MKTIWAICAAMMAGAVLSAPALAQDGRLNPPGGGQLPDDGRHDTNEPDKPGGEDGDGEPSPGGGAGDPPRDGDFEPVDVEFRATSPQHDRTGISMEEEDTQPTSAVNPDIYTDNGPDPAPQQAGTLPTFGGYTMTPVNRVCCRGFYGGAEWSARAACQEGGGDVAPDEVCRETDER
jgi:hypothetical protein